MRGRRTMMGKARAFHLLSNYLLSNTDLKGIIERRVAKPRVSALSIWCLRVIHGGSMAVWMLIRNRL
jgi:hypothetical protein